MFLVDFDNLYIFIIKNAVFRTIEQFKKICDFMIWTFYDNVYL